MSQLRDNTRFYLFHYLRLLIANINLGYLGKRVWIDNNVKFMRYPSNIYIDTDVIVKEGVRICSCNEKAKISIGARTTLGYNTFIFSSDSIQIGEDCLIAPFVYIVDSNHGIEKSKKINAQENLTSRVKIGNDVWIASNVTVLKGVVISDGAVIAANSVVNSDVGSYEIWGGTPARKIGERG